MQWTDEQKSAIETRDCNVLVAAAAGSGKTTVLVERIVQLITDPAKPTDIDRMLVTTFTEAAASKMKHEIGQALEKRLEANPEDKNLARQLVLLDNARICTVHAFCMRLVRTGFQKLDIEPDFGIGESGEMKLLLAKSVDLLFEELYENGDEGFLDLLESYTTARSDSGLRDILLALYHFAASMPFVDRYFDMANALYAIQEKSTHPWFCQIGEMAILRLQSCIQNLSRLQARTAFYDGLSKYGDALGEDISHLMHMVAVLKKGEFDRVGDLARNYKAPSARVGKDGDVDELLKKQISTARKERSDLLKEIGASYFPADAQRALADLAACGEKSRAISRMVLRLGEIYGEEKKSRGVLDFSDLEHMAVRLLCARDENGNLVPSDEAREIAAGLDYILVDEFQDTNALQETIFSMISRGDNLFMVGDVKQSIYSFRHTDPHIFKQKKDTFSDSAGKNRRVIMSQNFRSRSEVIDSVNQVFARVASEKVGEITYDATERLNAGLKYPQADGKTSGGKTEVLVGVGERAGISEDEMEAHIIARRILELLDSGYMLYDAKKDSMRPASFRDIVLLMRSYRYSASTYIQVLESYGIPCYADSGSGYFENSEITFMLSVLKAIDNPQQDIDLIAVMRSVLFGFDENDLLRIRVLKPGAPFYDCVCLCAKAEDALAKRCAAFVNTLTRWRSYVQYMTTYELIGALYRETDYDLFAMGQRNGAYRYENLNMLFERARAFDASGFKGLFNFITYIDGLKNAQTDDGDAKLIGEAQDVVRIMSIHKSKGLEFGVVFLAHATKAFNNRDLSSPLLMHKSLGLGFDVVDRDLCYKYPSAAKLAIREKLRMENLSEELRILYVGMTRAREKLIITGVKANFEFDSYAVEGESGSLPLFMPASAHCYLDWVMAAVMMQNGGRSEIEERTDTAVSTPLFEVQTFTQTYLTQTPVQTVSQADAAQQAAPLLTPEQREISAVMAYTYPHMADAALPSKVSVSEVKRMVETELDPEAVGWYDSGSLAVPQFGTNAEMDAAKRGTVMHYVLQLLDLSQVADESQITAQLERMVEDGILTKEERKCVRTEKIAGFFSSPLGVRMQKSGKVLREFPFEIQVPAEKLFAGYAGESHILVQGIVDCCFEEADGLVLLDYKTDRAKTPEDIEAIRVRYGVQVEYYARALSQITGKRVKEKYLYLLSAEQALEM